MGGNPLNVIDPLGLVGYVCQQGNNIGIAIPINFQGATRTQVARITNEIQSAWSGSFGKCNVRTVVVPQSRWDRGNGNGIAVMTGSGTSWVNAVDMNWGQWFFPGTWGDATFAHEAGHLLGLGHSTGIMSASSLGDPTVTEQHIRDVLRLDNAAIRRSCGC